MPTSTPLPSPQKQAHRTVARALATLISLFFVAMSAMVCATGHFYSNGGKYGMDPQDLTGSEGRTMAWVLLALAVFPTMAWASTPRQAGAVGALAAVALGTAIIFGIQGWS